MRILAPVQELAPAHVLAAEGIDPDVVADVAEHNPNVYILTGNPPRAQAVSSNPPNIDVDSSQRTGNERVHYIRYTREELRRIAESYEGYNLSDEQQAYLRSYSGDSYRDMRIAAR